MRISSITISAAGTRNGPNTFGSLKRPSARPMRVKRSLPGNATRIASDATMAEATAAAT